MSSGWGVATVATIGYGGILWKESRIRFTESVNLTDMLSVGLSLEACACTDFAILSVG